MIKLVKQPKDSVICGHCSVAMITEIDIQEVIDAVGIDERYGGGSTVEMQQEYLLAKGYTFTEKSWMDNRKAIDLSGKGIVCITDRGHNWGHAMAFENGEIYDPMGKVFADVKEMKKFYKRFYSGVKVYNVTTLEEGSK